MPNGARRIATIAIATTITIALSTVAAPATADPRPCIASASSACLAALQKKADAASKKAQIADEHYLLAKRAAAKARTQYSAADEAAKRAEVVAQDSRERAAAVAAQLARTGGSVGQTTEVLMSGDGVSEKLYHLSRMDELSQGTGDLADQAAADSRAADELQAAATTALHQLAAKAAKTKAAYRDAQGDAVKALALVVQAEGSATSGATSALSSAYADLPSDASTTERVLAFARSQIGDPYVLGAAGPTTWDCSGLTMMAYLAAGIGIGGHSATAQYVAAGDRGLLVPFAAAQPGDLVFYGTGGDKYHVAIYSGGGSMIEAPHPGAAVREVPVRTDDLAPMVARFSG